MLDELRRERVESGLGSVSWRWYRCCSEVYAAAAGVTPGVMAGARQLGYCETAGAGLARAGVRNGMAGDLVGERAWSRWRRRCQRQERKLLERALVQISRGSSVHALLARARRSGSQLFKPSSSAEASPQLLVESSPR